MTSKEQVEKACMSMNLVRDKHRNSNSLDLLISPRVDICHKGGKVRYLYPAPNIGRLNPMNGITS
jgi:hypothetical protein